MLLKVKNYFWYLIIYGIFSINYLLFNDLKNSLILSVILFGVQPLLSSFFNKKYEPISPMVLIPFVYMMYSIGSLYFESTYSNDTVIKYLIFQLIGMFFLRLGLNSHKILTKDNKVKLSVPITFKWMILVMLMLALFSFATEVASFGGLNNMLNIGYGADRFLHFNNVSMIGGGIQWLLLSAILLMYYGYKRNSNYLVIGIIITTFSFLVLFLIGGRSTIIYCLLFAFIIYYYSIKKISNRNIIIFLLLGVSVAQLWANSRYYLPEGIDETIKQTTRIFLENPDSFLPLPTNINEFRRPHESLLTVIEYAYDKRFYGRTYINALGSPIPLFNNITNTLGLNPSEWYLLKFYPDLFARGGGLGFSPVLEGYLNFGVLGISIHMYFYGKAASYFYANFKSKNDTASLLLYAGSLPIFALDGLRIHLASTLYKLFRIYLLPYILLKIIEIATKNLGNRIE